MNRHAVAGPCLLGALICRLTGSGERVVALAGAGVALESPFRTRPSGPRTPWGWRRAARGLENGGASLL